MSLIVLTASLNVALAEPSVYSPQARVGMEDFDEKSGPSPSASLQIGVEFVESHWSPWALVGSGRLNEVQGADTLLGLGVQYRFDVLRIVPYVSCGTRLLLHGDTYLTSCGAGWERLYQSGWFSSVEIASTATNTALKDAALSIFLGVGVRYDMNALN